MQYDPIKRSLGKFFNRYTWLRICFYRLLDILLLRAWYIHRELRRFSRLSSGTVEVFDAGSGFGQYAYYMARLSKNWHILGVDVKPEQIADCNAFFGKIGMGNRVSFREADLVQYEANDAFNLVLSVDVMEHIQEDVQVFKNFFRSMKKGGMLLISTPSDQGGSDAHNEEEASFVDEHVRNGYNINEIEEKLRTAGFTRVDASFSYGSLGYIAWRLSMKYPIILLNTSKLFALLLPFYYLVAWPVAFVLNSVDLHTRHRSGTGLIVKAWKE